MPQGFIGLSRPAKKVAIKICSDLKASRCGLTIFHNDNLTYAVNNWVGAAAAADRLSSRPTLRVLEIGAGTGSATEILLTLLGERELFAAT